MSNGFLFHRNACDINDYNFKIHGRDKMKREEDEFGKFLKVLLYTGLSILLTVPFYITFINPLVCIWQQRQLGLAELARAEANRQIKVCEAMAFKESAKSLADAEIIRARGVAEANQIIGNSLAQNEQYLRYLWIQNLKDNNKEVIYIPTEVNLPILEAQRLKGEK